MSQGGIPWWLSDKEVLVTQSHPTLSDPMDYSPVQAPLSMELSRQQNWSRLSFLSSGDLPDPAIKPGSPALQTDSLLSEPPGSSQQQKKKKKKNPPANTECTGSIPTLILEDSTCPGATKPWATTTDLCSTAWGPQLLSPCAVANEARVP